MPRVGVYVVEPSELNQPPAERTHEERGIYDESKAKWTETTDSRITIALPNEHAPYTIEEIQEGLESATVHVYREEEVPGSVSGHELTVRERGPASD